MRRFRFAGLAAISSAVTAAGVLGATAAAHVAATPAATTTTTTAMTSTAATTTTTRTSTTTPTSTTKPATTTTAAATKPSSTAAPTVSGTVQVGHLLTATNGNWDGSTPLTYSYQWRVCGANGGACRDIPGATGNEYSLKSQDLGNTLRVVVTAKNSAGSASATSTPTARVAAAAAAAPANGCPKLASGAASASIASLAPPARLQIDQTLAYPNLISRSTRSIMLKVHISSTCGAAIQGADVYVTGVPYNMVSIGHATTDAKGWATMRVGTLRGFPATPYQQLLVMFVRATKPGDNVLAGVSTRRLVSFRVNLHG